MPPSPESRSITRRWVAMSNSNTGAAASEARSPGRHPGALVYFCAGGLAAGVRVLRSIQGYVLAGLDGLRAVRHPRGVAGIGYRLHMPRPFQLIAGPPRGRPGDVGRTCRDESLATRISASTTTGTAACGDPDAHRRRDGDGTASRLARSCSTTTCDTGRRGRISRRSTSSATAASTIGIGAANRPE